MSNFPPLHPDDTAVVVIDVQAGLFRETPPPDDAAAVIARITETIAKARRAHAPIIFIQHDGPADGDWLLPFSADWQLHPELPVAPGDLIVRKTEADAFHGTTLEAELRARGSTTLLILGCATDFCVDATLHGAASRGFRVVVVSDAHTTTDRPDLAAVVIRQQHNETWARLFSNQGVAVVPAQEVTFSPRAAT